MGQERSGKAERSVGSRRQDPTPCRARRAQCPIDSDLGASPPPRSSGAGPPDHHSAHDPPHPRPRPRLPSARRRQTNQGGGYRRLLSGPMRRKGGQAVTVPAPAVSSSSPSQENPLPPLQPHGRPPSPATATRRHPRPTAGAPPAARPAATAQPRPRPPQLGLLRTAQPSNVHTTGPVRPASRKRPASTSQRPASAREPPSPTRPSTSAAGARIGARLWPHAAIVHSSSVGACSQHPGTSSMPPCRRDPSAMGPHCTVQGGPREGGEEKERWQGGMGERGKWRWVGRKVGEICI
jgi:hypothetical protein